MSKDTKAIIGTIVGTGLVLAGLLSAQLSSLNTRIDDLTASGNARFDDMHGRIDDVNANANARFSDLNARFSDLNARFDDLREDIRELRALVIEALKRTEPAD